MKLEELQSAFLGYVSGAATSAAILPFVRAHGRASASERLALYAGSFGRRAQERMARVFPKTAVLLGEQMLAMAQEHVSRIEGMPPPRPDVLQGWSPFLRARSPRPDRPDLPDLAALELARRDVADAHDSAPVGAESLAITPPERLGELCLRFIDGLETVHALFDVSDFWAAVEEREDLPPPRPGPTELLVWRRGRQVFHSVLAPAEAVALQAAREGAALSVVCAAFAREPAPDEAAYRAIAGWFSDGLVADVVSPEVP